MTQLLRSLRLTTNMQKVMAKILAAPTPAAAAAEISKGQNLVAARDILMKIGLITYKEQPDEATVTDQGQQVLRDENITDESGQLTDQGQQLAYDGAAPGTIDTNAPGPTDLGNLGGEPAPGAAGAPPAGPEKNPFENRKYPYGLLKILNG